MTVRTLIGDVRDRLKELPDESIHCVVTSPPYWGLRDYGVAGQLGLEPTLGEHVETMASIFDEVRRVLRKDGTLWLNYGDSYAAQVNGRSAHDTKLKGNDDRSFRDKPFSTVGPIWRDGKNPDDRLVNGRNRNGMAGFMAGTLKPKDLCGVPWRVAFALQDRGWWLRQDIIWAKPNPMPESVTDRCTKAHEYVFLLAKSERYYFDQEAISEPADRAGDIPGGSVRYIDNSLGSCKDGLTINAQKPVAVSRNRRSVWTIATAPFSEAHFATFPPELAELCIKAGTSQKGACASCGRPWMREMEQLNPGAHPTVKDSGGIAVLRNLGHDYERPQTLGWSPSCQCSAAIVHCTVLDPFGGAGTTGLVADRLQRHCILIELNPAYAQMAKARIDDDRGGLLDLMEAAP